MLHCGRQHGVLHCAVSFAFFGVLGADLVLLPDIMLLLAGCLIADCILLLYSCVNCINHKLSWWCWVHLPTHAREALSLSMARGAHHISRPLQQQADLVVVGSPDEPLVWWLGPVPELMAIWHVRPFRWGCCLGGVTA